MELICKLCLLWCFSGDLQEKLGQKLEKAGRQTWFPPVVKDLDYWSVLKKDCPQPDVAWTSGCCQLRLRVLSELIYLNIRDARSSIKVEESNMIHLYTLLHSCQLKVVGSFCESCQVKKT